MCAGFWDVYTYTLRILRICSRLTKDPTIRLSVFTGLVLLDNNGKQTHNKDLNEGSLLGTGAFFFSLKRSLVALISPVFGVFAIAQVRLLFHLHFCHVLRCSEDSNFILFLRVSFWCHQTAADRCLLCPFSKVSAASLLPSIGQVPRILFPVVVDGFRFMWPLTFTFLMFKANSYILKFIKVFVVALNLARVYLS